MTFSSSTRNQCGNLAEAGRSRNHWIPWVRHFALSLSNAPVINEFFHLVGPTSNDADLEANYEDHQSQLIDVLYDCGASNPEMELLGEAIKRRWDEPVRKADHALYDAREAAAKSSDRRLLTVLNVWPRNTIVAGNLTHAERLALQFIDPDGMFGADY